MPMSYERRKRTDIDKDATSDCDAMTGRNTLVVVVTSAAAVRPRPMSKTASASMAYTDQQEHTTSMGRADRLYHVLARFRILRMWLPQ